MENRKDMIIQANPLIEARKPFNTMQARLFYLALQNVNPHLSANDKYYDKEFKESFFTPSELKEIFGGSGEYIKLAKKACKTLTKEVIEIQDKDKKDAFKFIPIFSIAEYEPNKGLRLVFNPFMRPYLLDIFDSGFPYTRISIKQIFNLSSAYAMRVLELMLQYRGLMKNKIISRQMTVAELRFCLNVPETAYILTSDFKRFVLEVAKKEINKKTAYRFAYDSIKTGRKITAFYLTLDCRDVLLENEAVNDVKVERIPGKKDRHGLSAKVINKLTTICGSNEEFKKRMDYAVSLLEKRKPEKPEAFLYKAVAENYLQQELDRQEEVQKKAREKKEWDDFLGNLDGEAKHVLERMITIGKIAPLMAKSLLERFGAERCRRNFEAQRINPMVKNLAGAAVMAIQQDWQGQIDAFTTEMEQQAEQQEQDTVDEQGRQIVYIGGKKYYVEPDPVVEKIDEDKLDPALREFLDHRLGRDKEMKKEKDF